MMTCGGAPCACARPIHASWSLAVIGRSGTSARVTLWPAASRRLAMASPRPDASPITSQRRGCDNAAGDASSDTGERCQDGTEKCSPFSALPALLRSPTGLWPAGSIQKRCRSKG
jgi:hypothetical protein